MASQQRKLSNCLYTPEQRVRRDQTRWTLVQGILAPAQFAVFLVSLFLTVRFLINGSGFELATISILAKVALLYLIMVTGAIWEKVVFGQYLFAPAFFWEDVISMGVIALHTAYLLVWWFELLGPIGQVTIALLAYLAYVVNAAQFLLKLRAARLQQESDPATQSPSQSSALAGATQ